MTTWQEFARQAPDMAAFGAARFESGVAYLGTLRADGGPRIHPITPILGAQLYVFMEPTSPKGKDLQRDPRYTLHCSVTDANGGEGEFYVRGEAALVTNPALRAAAEAAAPYAPAERYVLFALAIQFAFMNTYDGSGANPRRWSATTVT